MTVKTLKFEKCWLEKEKNFKIKHGQKTIMKHIKEYKRQGEDNEMQVLHKYNCRRLQERMKQKQCFKRQWLRDFQKWIKDILEAVGNLRRNKQKFTPRYIMVKLFKTKTKIKHKPKQL